MKLKIKLRRFDSIKEIQTVSQNMKKMQTQYDFQKCFQLWESRWNRCITAKGDDFEGVGAYRNFGKLLSYGRGISGNYRPGQAVRSAGG